MIFWSNSKTNIMYLKANGQYARHDNYSLSTITATERGVVDERFTKR